MLDLLAARLPGRTIQLVGDAAYATTAWRGLAGQLTLTSRLRSNGVIFKPAPPRTGKRGRPVTWGKRLPTLTQIATDTATEWTAATVRRYANTETLMLHTIDCLWEPLGAETPVRVTIVQDLRKSTGYQIALITTDLASTSAQMSSATPTAGQSKSPTKKAKNCSASDTPATAPATQSSAPRPSSSSA